MAAPGSRCERIPRRLDLVQPVVVHLEPFRLALAPTGSSSDRTKSERGPLEHDTTQRLLNGRDRRRRRPW